MELGLGRGRACLQRQHLRSVTDMGNGCRKSWYWLLLTVLERDCLQELWVQHCHSSCRHGTSLHEAQSFVYTDVYAVVKPLLKKPTPDDNNLKNVHPVSILSFLSKIIEKNSCCFKCLIISFPTAC